MIGEQPQAPSSDLNGAAAQADPASVDERPAGPYDSSGRRITLEPPAWDPVPPHETVRRYQG